MAIVISLANQKGGVAKTTSTYNIGYLLSQKGYRTLMIDLDPQSSLTDYTGTDPYNLEKTVADLLLHEKEPAKDVIITLRENLSLLPTSPSMARKELEINSRRASETSLKRVLNQLTNDYDFILIDCPPQLSTLTINALAASDGVIIPCTTEYMAYRSIDLLVETVEDVQELFNPNLTILGIIATRVKTRDKDGQEILQALKDEQTILGVIKESVDARKGLYDGMSISEYNQASDVSKGYMEVVDSVLKIYE